MNTTIITSQMLILIQSPPLISILRAFPKSKTMRNLTAIFTSPLDLGS